MPKVKGLKKVSTVASIYDPSVWETEVGWLSQV